MLFVSFLCVYCCSFPFLMVSHFEIGRHYRSSPNQIRTEGGWQNRRNQMAPWVCLDKMRNPQNWWVPCSRFKTTPRKGQLPSKKRPSLTSTLETRGFRSCRHWWIYRGGGSPVSPNNVISRHPFEWDACLRQLVFNGSGIHVEPLGQRAGKSFVLYQAKRNCDDRVAMGGGPIAMTK